MGAQLGSPSSAPQLNTNPGSLIQRNSSLSSRTSVMPWPSVRPVSTTRSRWPSVSNATSCPAWKPMISPPAVATTALCTQQDAAPATADRSAQSRPSVEVGSLLCLRVTDDTSEPLCLLAGKTGAALLAATGQY